MASEPAKLRVAAYARVSTDSLDQQNSYLAQVDHYTKYISQNEDWELVDVYADEGISGMETRNREDFNRMLEDCRAGNIDRILVKSISRFTRNTKEYLQTVRELIRLGISIYFEKENIDTGKMSNEQISTIYGAFAQLESTGHSSNMRISNRIRMEKGIFLPSSVPYGYRLQGRVLEIIPEEARVVKTIFASYLVGKGIDEIAKELNRQGVPRNNKQKKWHPYGIRYILTNITYTGDTIWQKTFAGDTIPFPKVMNVGQKPKYFVERGKIDLIITKSVSRFCRNTLDGLDYVRRLKRLGVGVLFEKENVNTLYMANEMILTFMMSQAQAESESMSGNIIWRHRMNFKEGKVYYSYKNFLGYQKGENGQPEIVPEEAAIVRRIFSRYLLGQSVRQIAIDLTADGIKTTQGRDVWHDGVIQRMLQNEKYIGDALLQKTYCEDLFTRKRLVNNGKLPKYYVHECHPAIIDRETFQRVQEEIARRSSIRRTSARTKTELGKYSGKYVLSELLVCGECGCPYRRVIWTQKGEKRVVWRCINRLEHGITTFDEMTIRQLVSSIKVLDRERLLVCFRDGEQIVSEKE